MKNHLIEYKNFSVRSAITNTLRGANSESLCNFGTFENLSKNLRRHRNNIIIPTYRFETLKSAQKLAFTYRNEKFFSLVKTTIKIYTNMLIFWFFRILWVHCINAKMFGVLTEPIMLCLNRIINFTPFLSIKCACFYCGLLFKKK